MSEVNTTPQVTDAMIRAGFAAVPNRLLNINAIELGNIYTAMFQAHPTDEEEVERVARVLHNGLFATVTDWREEMCEWESLPAGPREEFMSVARAALNAIRRIK